MIGDPQPALGRPEGVQRSGTPARSVSVVRDLVNGRASRPLRIALIAPSQYPIASRSPGGSRRWCGSCDRARARGHDVSLFAAEGSDGADERHVLPVGGWAPSRTAAGDCSMPVEGFMSAHHAYLRLLMSLAGRWADELRRRPQPRPAPPARSRWRRCSGMPVLTTLHTPPTPWLESAVIAAPTRGDAPGRVRRGQRLHRPGVAGPAPDDAASVVLNGVDLGDVATRSAVATAGLVGRFVPEKAPHLAIEAARRAGMPITLAGPVVDRTYFAEAIRPRLGPDVEYGGHLADPGPRRAGRARAPARS